MMHRTVRHGQRFAVSRFVGACPARGLRFQVATHSSPFDAAPPLHARIASSSRGVADASASVADIAPSLPPPRPREAPLLPRAIFGNTFVFTLATTSSDGQFLPPRDRPVRWPRECWTIGWHPSTICRAPFRLYSFVGDSCPTDWLCFGLGAPFRCPQIGAHHVAPP